MNLVGDLGPIIGASPRRLHAISRPQALFGFSSDENVAAGKKIFAGSTRMTIVAQMDKLAAVCVVVTLRLRRRPARYLPLLQAHLE